MTTEIINSIISFILISALIWIIYKIGEGKGYDKGWEEGIKTIKRLKGENGN